ncbi:MAG: HNH endonuclease, partial [Bacteroidetes bacterium]
MKTCIICRIEKAETKFNDEHVIPDSIGGYYHIYLVCTKCNSNLGSKVDNKLTNHQFINFQRNLTNTKGKSGKVPNPFSGTHTLKNDEDQKVRLELNEDGAFEVRLIPNVPKAFTNEFKIVVDKKDEHKIDEIIAKFLKRNGIPKEKVKIHQSECTTEKPWVHTTMTIDIKDFKMGILKIIYEFAVDSIPPYFFDSNAVLISKILETADFENLYSEITFIGDGFNKEIL